MGVSMLSSTFESLGRNLNSSSAGLGDFLSNTGMLIPALVMVTKSIFTMGTSITAETEKESSKRYSKRGS